MGTFFGKIEIWKINTLLSSDVEMHLSDLTLTLSRNNKIYPETEKKIYVNRTPKISHLVDAVTELWARGHCY